MSQKQYLSAWVSGVKNLASKLFLLIALEFMAYKPRGRIYGFSGLCLELLLPWPWKILKKILADFCWLRGGGGADEVKRKAVFV